MDINPIYIPILVSFISALSLLIGYAFQKNKEKQFEIDRTRQEIYTRLIKNLSAKLDLFDRIRKDPEMPKRATTENVDSIYKLISKKYQELELNLKEGRELMALMALYASDEALNACISFYKESWQAMQIGSDSSVDLGLMIEQLRKSIFPKSKIASGDINLLLSK